MSSKNLILSLLLSIFYILNIATLNTEGLDLINDYEQFTSQILKPEEINKIVTQTYQTCKNNDHKICEDLNKNISSISENALKIREKVNTEIAEMKNEENLNEFNFKNKKINSNSNYNLENIDNILKKYKHYKIQ